MDVIKIMGIGDWGLGVWGWGVCWVGLLWRSVAVSRSPNAESPIPNPHDFYNIHIIFK